jgi:hypothetical protein
MMQKILEVEVIMKIRTVDYSYRALHVDLTGVGAARAVARELDLEFTLSPPPSADENTWVLLARIASEGARAEAKKFL